MKKAATPPCLDPSQLSVRTLSFQLVGLFLGIIFACSSRYSSQAVRPDCLVFVPFSFCMSGILSRAISKLEDNPHPNLFGTGPEMRMLEYVATEMTLPYRMLTANLWLFSPLVAWVYARKPQTNAFARTTTAVTRFNAGVKDNVISPEAVAVIDHRIHPMSSVEEVMEHDLKVINDPRVKINVINSLEPAPTSPYGKDSPTYMVLQETIQQVGTYVFRK